MIEPLPTADPNEPVPDWIKALYSGFPGATAEKISSEIDLIAMEYAMVVRSADKPSVKIKSIPDDLILLYKLPDAKAASELKHAPLKGVRDIIARVFVDDGWKQLPDGKQAGVYEPRKSSAGGRSLSLTFRIQKPRPSSRSILGTLRFVYEGVEKSVAVRAERSLRSEYEVPNPRFATRSPR